MSMFFLFQKSFRQKSNGWTSSVFLTEKSLISVFNTFSLNITNDLNILRVQSKEICVVCWSSNDPFWYIYSHLSCTCQLFNITQYNFHVDLCLSLTLWAVMFCYITKCSIYIWLSFVFGTMTTISSSSDSWQFGIDISFEFAKHKILFNLENREVTKHNNPIRDIPLRRTSANEKWQEITLLHDVMQSPM